MNTTRTAWLRTVMVVLCVVSGVACADGPAVAKKTATKHFLWQVKSKTATVYLLGSVHAAKKELYPLDAVIMSAFKASGTVVFEVPMDPKTQLDALVKLTKAARYDAGDSLEKHLDKETKTRLDAYVKRAELDAATLNTFRPWYVAISVTMHAVQESGYSAADGIDLHFLKQAQDAKKPVVGLETVDDQVGALKNLDEKVQLKMLRGALDEAAKTRESLDKLFKAWKTGDVKALDELMLMRMRNPEYQPLYKALFLDRNKRMAKKIEGFLATDKTYFVIVGAGHLVGKGSIVDLLSATKRYSVAQQ